MNTNSNRQVCALTGKEIEKDAQEGPDGNRGGVAREERGWGRKGRALPQARSGLG